MKSNNIHLPALADLLASTLQQDWAYLETLKIKSDQLHEASYEMIMSNPGDIAIGVNRVQVVLDHFFFGLFDCLVIKHFITGEVNLMFNTETSDSKKVLGIFNQLTALLVNGWTFEPRFSNFTTHGKLYSLASGHYTEDSDEILQIWNLRNFSITLNYKLEPLRQLLLSVNQQVKKEPDQLVRANGTILNLLTISPERLLDILEVRNEPHEEDGVIKFIDYTLQLVTPELNLFDRVRLRIFSTKRTLDTNVQMHISYFSDFEMNASEVIGLVNKVASIYGKDNYGMMDMEPHEIDIVEANQMWTGRSWILNRSHSIYDFNDPTQSIMYQISITVTPEHDGIALRIIGYDQMIEFQELLSEVYNF